MPRYNFIYDSRIHEVLVGDSVFFKINKVWHLGRVTGIFDHNMARIQDADEGKTYDVSGNYIRKYPVDQAYIEVQPEDLVLYKDRCYRALDIRKLIDGKPGYLFEVEFANYVLDDEFIKAIPTCKVKRWQHRAYFV